MHRIKLRLLRLSAIFTIAFLLGIFATQSAKVHAGKADVIKVVVKALDDNRYRFDVTVKHADAGWEHYADKWEVISLDGEVIDTRVLAHPHDNEQPFTRSLTLTIPVEHKQVIVRAGDSVHGDGGLEITVDVPVEGK